MKFVHTADWQIGMKAAHVGAVGGRIREARLEAARKVIQAAEAQGAEFILLAGDTFEDNGVDRVLVQKTADILGKSPVPVYIIPGNHDPLVPGSVWDHPAWAEHENLHVLESPEPLETPGGTLYPCPVLEKHSRKDPTAWIDAAQAEGLRIGLAHGTVEGMPQVAPDHPVPRDAALRTGLDYLALGHWHSTATYEDRAGTVRMAYSGTHETTRFGERDSGNVLLVEIPKAGAPPKITLLRTGTLAWLTLDEQIGQEGDLARVRSLVEQVENPDATLIEVRLSGLLPGSVGPELGRLEEVLESRFLHHRLDTDGLRPAPEDETWLEGLPQGVLREAALQLRELAAAEQTSTSTPEASPKVAAQALMELYALVQGAES
ncbi:MAG: metallophosphoesterase family protein [Longimicrobiales bacterium]